MRIESTGIVLVLAACSTPLPPHAPAPDATWIDAYREDTGPVVVFDGGTTDASVGIDSALDANVDAVSIDAGDNDAGMPLQITIDGDLSDPFWSMAGGSMNSTTMVVSPYDGDALTSFHYARDDAWFYMGFEGTLVSGDAVVVYVDTHFGDGVMLTTGLSDSTNAVNAVLSLQITGTAEFQPEYGWGTSAMPHTLTTSDPTLGWRTLAANPSHFSDVVTNTQSACSSTGCETAISLAQLGVPSGGLIALVARLGRPGVGFSNQTFPASDAATPETIDLPINVPLM